MGFDTSRLTIIDHPLVQHKLHILRDRDTPTKQFRELVGELAIFEGYEAMRDFPLEDIEVTTPLEKTVCKRIAGKKVAIIPILRAGLGMVDGLLSLVPSARVGHVGMYRDPTTHAPHQYYCKFPPDVESRTCLIVDPMLATGGSLTAAIQFLREAHVRDIRALTIVSSGWLWTSILTCGSIPVRSTGGSTRAPTSCRAWVTRGIVSMVPSRGCARAPALG